MTHPVRRVIDSSAGSHQRCVVGHYYSLIHPCLDLCTFYHLHSSGIATITPFSFITIHPLAGSILFPSNRRSRKDGKEVNNMPMVIMMMAVGEKKV